jgi:uncharacterized membrane protein YedE/YeeE
MTNFTPIPSFFGGVLIGLSAAAMLLLDGKIAGVSGIFAGVLRPVKKDTLWRACFIGGLIVGGLILRVLLPEAFDFGAIRSMGALTVAGLLVGFGTRLGNGCTSGHGVCGVARLSVRSIAATATFMTAGTTAVYAVNHLLGGSL